LLNSRLRRGADAVEQLCAGDERDAEAGTGQDQSAVSRIALKVVDASFDGAHGDRICDEIRLEARLDDEQAANLAKHVHG
jgi:hypothetical protein